MQIVRLSEAGAGRAAGVPAFALFQYGFRPFFLLGGTYACLAVALWMLAWHGLIASPTRMPPQLWHAHEMVFGFAAAAVAGFLLTAVPSWTATGPVRGTRLAVLTMTWLVGRALAWVPDVPMLFAVVDLAFIPLLALMVAPGILTRNGRRNGIFVALLAVFTVANLGYHAEALEWVQESAESGISLAIAVLLVMIAVVGGRIVPAFTIGGMRMAGRPVSIEAAPRLDIAAIAALAATVILDLLGAAPAVIGAVAALAAGLHAARLIRWQGWRSFRVPLVAILHVGYAWMPIGLALKAASAFDAVPSTTAVHAFTAGCIATMILAVMTRASLGHTGRPLVASKAATLSYVLVTAGAILRVFASLAPEAHVLIIVAALAWGAGFCIFAAAYLPILAGPRADGRPG